MSDAEDAVELSVEIAARPATVFRCVTQSDLLSRWLQAEVRLEPRVGGDVRIDFARYGTVVEGRVLELRTDELVVFSWGVAAGPQAAEMPAGSTRVSLRLTPTAAGTRVTLRHEGIPTAQGRRDHAMGWTGYLGSLAGVAPLANVEGGVEALWDRWFAAWAETDGAARDRLLGATLADDGTFADSHAEGRGREFVSEWIGVCQGMFPGTRLSRDGPVLHTRGALLVEWQAHPADGSKVARGINHGRLSADGRLAGVEGFWRT